MEIQQAIRDRIDLLIRQSPPLLVSLMAKENDDSWYRAQAWIASAVTAVRLLSPQATLHRQIAEGALESENTGWKVGTLAAILSTLIEDIDSGLIISLQEAARAEITDDYLDLAEAYLDSGDPAHVGIAGAIASVVFEDSIRRACEKVGIVTAPDTELEQRINALKGKGALSKIKSQLAKSGASLRNQAMHADWSFTAVEVRHAISITRTLVSDLLGG